MRHPLADPIFEQNICLSKKINIEARTKYLLIVLLFCFLRKDGIVVAVTFWQWLVEFCFNIFTIGFVLMMGTNRQVDHFLAMFGIFFSVSVLPSFYLMACAEFRRNLENQSIIKAFWITIIKENFQCSPRVAPQVVPQVAPQVAPKVAHHM